MSVKLNYANISDGKTIFRNLTTAQLVELALEKREGSS